MDWWYINKAELRQDNTQPEWIIKVYLSLNIFVLLIGVYKLESRISNTFLESLFLASNQSGVNVA